VIFFGGLEYDVRKQVADRYVSMDPAEENQDSGNIRLYTGKLSDRTYEFKNSLQVFCLLAIRVKSLSPFSKSIASITPTSS
jgi:hypothetical protein